MKMGSNPNLAGHCIMKSIISCCKENHFGKESLIFLDEVAGISPTEFKA